ncbi:MAG TPA: molybdenum cofactor guanylyltransferase [Verrucomicrobiales bacterium]|nr:molybdenum cofactor guanylyltransferase [Verrucomicrobiales bacterium]HIL70083.1 molybdenum cofactor guanylyltransferase [Verrucomicrobiota bacterium]
MPVTDKWKDMDGAVCVLAGGGSRRMGKNKARLKLAGVSLLRHTIRSVSFLNWPVHVIRHDRIQKCGPLSGIYTAFLNTQKQVLLILPCDMPLLTSALLLELLQKFDNSSHGIFSFAGDRYGFPILLKRKSMDGILNQIEQGDYSIQSLAERLPGMKYTVPKEKTRELMNINTTKELTHAASLVSKNH